MKRQSSLYPIGAAFLALWTGQALAAQAKIDLRPGQIASLGIRTAMAESATDYLLATLPAVIAPPPNARVAVAATFPGTVQQTLAVEGEMVKKGQALAVIASREVMQESAGLAQARAKLAVAESNAARQRRLGAEGIVAGARVDEAEAELAQAKADAAAKAAILAAVGAEGGTYTLRAPIDGVVASAHIETGHPVDTANAPFVVDAVGSHEIEAQVPERLVGKIAPGMRVTVGALEAKVTSVGSVIQADTRSAALKARIAPNSGAVAGRTVLANVFAPAPAGAVRLPKAALTDLNGAPVVFVQTGGDFLVRPVTTAGAGGAEIVILSGVAPGEAVVTAGLSELKSIALAK